MEVGDQILEVNGVNFIGIVHGDAANALRYCIHTLSYITSPHPSHAVCLFTCVYIKVRLCGFFLQSPAKHGDEAEGCRKAPSFSHHHSWQNRLALDNLHHPKNQVIIHKL